MTDNKVTTLFSEFGVTKWFGGFNKRKQKNIDYGFIDGINGQCIYVSRNELKNADKIAENDLVIFNKKTIKGEVFATNVYLLNLEDKSFLTHIIRALKTPEQAIFILKSPEYRCFFVKLINSFNQASFFRAIFELPKLLNTLMPIVKASSKWEHYFLTHFKNDKLSNLITSGIAISNIPSEFIDSRLEELASYIDNLNEEINISTIEALIKVCSINTALYLVLKKIITNPIFLEPKIKELHEFLHKWFLKQDTEINDEFRTLYNEKCGSFNNFAQHPVILPLILPFWIKLKIYRKDMSFIDDLKSNNVLIATAEFYILEHVVPLLSKENIRGDYALENVIRDDIWQGLIDEKIDLNDDSLLNLFPQCHTMKKVGKGIPLSCEAYTWVPKDTDESVFLCRSSKCINPKVFPKNKHRFWSFTIYDWLSHFGIMYSDSSKPSKRDFPIKLAGYINRLKELFHRLHCRTCKTILRPKLEYARDRAVVFDAYTGKFEEKNIQAAYRITVFECGNQQCSEHGSGIYVTHCLNFKCYEYIDSRDSQMKCDNDRYICVSCKSCCPEHDKNKAIN
jgi:hypothetical protein